MAGLQAIQIQAEKPKFKQTNLLVSAIATSQEIISGPVNGLTPKTRPS